MKGNTLANLQGSSTNINLTPEQAANFRNRLAADPNFFRTARAGVPAGQQQLGLGPSAQAPGAAPLPQAAGTAPLGTAPAQNPAWQGQPAGGSGFETSSPTMAPGAPKYGLAGAEDALQRGLVGAVSGVEAGMNQAADTLSPYTQGGASAYQLQGDLSGANGREAQQRAFDNYNQSPELAYAMQQGEKAITRNAAATGGRVGGNVLQALQGHAIGMAQQDYGNAFDRLGSLSAMGHNSSNLLGGLQANAGGKVGDYAYGTGNALASGRTRAGEMIAGNVQDTSQGLAGMIDKQGTDLSNIIGKGGTNMSELLASYGINDAQQLQDLAALLSNARSGSASTVAGASGLPGVNDQGLLGPIAQLAGGIGGAMSGYSQWNR